MKKLRQFAMALGCIFFTIFNLFSQNVNVTFNVNIENIYNKENLEIYISGDFPGYFWAEPGADPSLMLSDPDNDSIYSLTLSLPSGSYNYKYFEGPGWECGEWEGDPNRTLDLQNTSVETNDGWGLISPNELTFTISNNNQPIENALVKIFDEYSTVSNSDGIAWIELYQGCRLYYDIFVGEQKVYTDTFNLRKDMNIEVDISAQEVDNNFNLFQVNANYVNGNIYVYQKKHQRLLAEIYNMKGHCIYSQNYQVNQFRINTSFFENGIYILKLQNLNGDLQKILKFNK